MYSLSQDLWKRVKGALLPYEGLSSQIYILDLPISEIRNVLTTFEESVSGCRVTGLNGTTYDTSRPMTESLKDQACAIAGPFEHSFKGVMEQKLLLSLYLSTETDVGLFDAEIVFWGDHFFPEPDDDEASRKNMEALIDLASRLKVNAQSSQLVVSPQPVGHPSDKRAEDVWLEQ